MSLKYITIAAITILMAAPAFAEKIYLKSGGVLMGEITEESGDQVVIRMSIGTLTVNRGEIESIEGMADDESDEFNRDMERQAVESGDWAPYGGEKLRDAFLRAKRDRQHARALQSRRKIVKGSIDGIESDIRSLHAALGRESEKLQGLDPEKQVVRYNAVVAGMNRLGAEMEEKKDKVADLSKRFKQLSGEASRATGGYNSAIQSLDRLYGQSMSGLNRDEMEREEIDFYDIIGEELADMKSDFEEYVLEYDTSAGQIIVSANINGRTYANLLVDTGASLVVISETVAYQLGIDPGEIVEEIDTVMADGSVSAAKPVVLDSVAVGDAEVNGVPAAIIKGSGSLETDGLLGMTFLENFTVQIDKANNRITLERLAP